MGKEKEEEFRRSSRGQGAWQGADCERKKSAKGDNVGKGLGKKEGSLEEAGEGEGPCRGLSGKAGKI